MLSDCIIYVTAVAFMCFANKHIIIIINMHELLMNGKDRLREFNLKSRHPYICVKVTPRRCKRQLQWLRAHAPVPIYFNWPIDDIYYALTSLVSRFTIPQPILTVLAIEQLLRNNSKVFGSKLAKGIQSIS
jgi:hypothetical protein